MRSRYFQFVGLLFAVASVILASCGGGGGGSSAGAGAPSIKGTSGNAVNMDGTWTAPCSYDSTNQEDTKDTVTISGGSFTYTSKAWSAAGTASCTQTAVPDMLMSISGTITTGATGTAIWMNGIASAPTPSGIPANAKATSATITYTSALVTLGSATYVAYANSAPALCGRTWVINVAQNVLNCTDLMPSTTDQDYWVIDDSTSTLKWYSNLDDIAWHVDIGSIMTK